MHGHGHGHVALRERASVAAADHGGRSRGSCSAVRHPPAAPGADDPVRQPILYRSLLTTWVSSSATASAPPAVCPGRPPHRAGRWRPSHDHAPRAGSLCAGLRAAHPVLDGIAQQPLQRHAGGPHDPGRQRRDCLVIVEDGALLVHGREPPHRAGTGTHSASSVAATAASASSSGRSAAVAPGRTRSRTRICSSTRSSRTTGGPKGAAPRPLGVAPPNSALSCARLDGHPRRAP